MSNNIFNQKEGVLYTEGTPEWLMFILHHGERVLSGNCAKLEKNIAAPDPCPWCGKKAKDHPFDLGVESWWEGLRLGGSGTPVYLRVFRCHQCQTILLEEIYASVGRLDYMW